ncbi:MULTISPECIES: hypothetical protein [unclassified Niallia]
MKANNQRNRRKSRVQKGDERHYSEGQGKSSVHKGNESYYSR